MAQSERERFKSSLRKSFVVSFGGQPRKPIEKIRSSCYVQLRKKPSNLAPFTSQIIQEMRSEH